jgi:FtsP/CotA-like multicopper oxidase with cupredoxin domain
MHVRRGAILRHLLLALVVLSWGAAPGYAKNLPASARPTPKYFGPDANYANSPMPKGFIASITVDAGGTGYTGAPVVTIADAYGTGSGATATATVVGGVITAIAVDNAGGGYSAPVVVITDASGVDAFATPVLGGLTGGLRKFVDNVAGLGYANRNTLGNYIPVATPDSSRYPGADYYEIELGEYTQRFHSDLPATTLRGYRQVNVGAPDNNFRYLGPLILADRDRPVRVKFTNKLPTGAGGDLFIPVDTTVMGAGMGPKDAMGADCDPAMGPCEMYPQNRATLHMHGALVPWISDGTPHQWTTPAGENTVYPHGVSVHNVPDMPDNNAATGEPPQGTLTFYYNNQQSARLMWYHDHAYGITRLNVYTGMAAGYLLRDDVEADLINGTDNTGVNPNRLSVLPGIGTPLILQEKTFVDNTTIFTQDPNWRWGLAADNGAVTGSLWVPNVYMPFQNPYDQTGGNAYGRWQYGPWFWPPTSEITFPPIVNVNYDPNCDSYYTGTPCEPPYLPATPNPSMGMEAFNDTPLVNGTAYPYMAVEPKAYRFRILNASNDRFFNLQMYVAADKTTPTTVDNSAGAVLCDNTFVGPVANCTEVKMVPALLTPGFPAKWSTDGRAGGVPDPATRGPSWIQIGTEGGFLPAPVVVPNQPVNWNMNAGAFNVGNVTDHALVLAAAERADAIVDFSQYAGQTLILYNDSPAPYPALDPRYDYYTGDPNQMDTGGAPTTQPGYGPNTRTILQIRVGTSVTTPTTDVTLANLEAVFRKTATKRGVFEVSQDPVIVPQAQYNSAYDNTFHGDWRAYVRIFDTSMTFTPIGRTDNVTIDFQPKAMHDEMGAAYDVDYGRMSGMLGLEVPGATATTQNILLYGYATPPVDLLQDSSMTQIGATGDGTQIWKITHNGVDTHPIHWHLVNVQLINRVAWDGALMPPDANELGWKETLRVNPLEDTIVALRPVAPTQPFDVPNSVRPIDPTMPIGAPLRMVPGGGGPGMIIAPDTTAVQVLNRLVNYGWEYVWHCHILSHEEMDMMHSLGLATTPAAPSTLVATKTGRGAGTSIGLSWIDESVTETDFVVQRTLDNGATWVTLATIPSTTGPTSGSTIRYTDPIGATTASFFYRVFARNTVGDPTIYAVGPPDTTFPTVFLDSDFSNIATTSLGAPTNLTATLVASSQVLLTWIDTATNETGFLVERSTNGGAYAQITVAGPKTNTGTVTFTDTTADPGFTYQYRVAAIIEIPGFMITSAYATSAPLTVAVPTAPSNLRATATRQGNTASVTLTWQDNSNNEGGFTVQRATNSAFTTGLVSSTTAANTTALQIGSLARLTNYYFRIRAYNLVGTSGWVTATPLPIRTP